MRGINQNVPLLDEYSPLTLQAKSLTIDQIKIATQNSSEKVDEVVQKENDSIDTMRTNS